MKNLTLFFISIFSIFTYTCSNEECNNNEKYIVGYFFPKDSVANEKLIEVDKLTHINYAFANIKNGEISEGFKNDSINFSIINQTKIKNPNLKLIISLGGWTWSGNFSDVSLTESSRKKFIESGIRFIKKYNLDGIDLDWEFPGLIGYGNVYRKEDKENFTALLKEFRTALDDFGLKEDKHFLLTIAAAAFDEYLENTEMGKVQKYLDFINIMAYDLYESDYDTSAGHHTPLFTNKLDKKGLSADAAVRKFLQAGVPTEKIVLGVAFYGRTFQTTSSQNHGLFQKAGPIKERIRASFKNLKINLENQHGFVRYWDSLASAPYLFNEQKKIFITYDDEESLKAKCKYINEHKLKGVMFWEYHSDYENRLLSTLYDALQNK